MSVLRKCRKCGLEAHSEDALVLFVSDSTYLFGRRPFCKQCKRQQYRVWYLKRREEARERLERYRDQPCVFCGEPIGELTGLTDMALVLHSVDGNHDNWEKANKVPVHRRCHTIYHHSKSPVTKLAYRARMVNLRT